MLFLVFFLMFPDSVQKRNWQEVTRSCVLLFEEAFLQTLSSLWPCECMGGEVGCGLGAREMCCFSLISLHCFNFFSHGKCNTMKLCASDDRMVGVFFEAQKGYYSDRRRGHGSIQVCSWGVRLEKYKQHVLLLPWKVEKSIIVVLPTKVF